MAEHKRKGLRVAGTYTGEKVPKFTKWFYPFSGIFRDACYALVGSFLLQYAITSGVLSNDPETFASQYGIITIAMMVALIWDGINDPIMGFIVEKVHFKLGKFKPWILIGAIGNAVAVVLMFLIRPGSYEGGTWVANGWAYVGWMIAFYFLWDLFFTMNDIGYWAMLPSLTSDEHERAQLTSRVSIAAAVGGFLMTAVATLLPSAAANFGSSAAGVYAAMAIVVSILFLASQAIVFFFCQEKQRDLEQEQKSEESSLVDLFKVVAKNPQVRVAVIAMFLYYLGSGVLTGGIGVNYYNFAAGYGTFSGGIVTTVISVMYVIGMIASQAAYPAMAKKMPKQKILTLGTIIAVLGGLGFFLTCFPLFGDKPFSLMFVGESPAYDAGAYDFGWIFGGTMFCNYIFPAIFFFGMGLIYMVVLVMFQDAIDYNEYKFGERKESVISAWRPLDVKLGSALLRGIQYLVFISAGVMGVVNGISNAEGLSNAKAYTSSEFIVRIKELMNGVNRSSLNIIGIWVLVILMGCVIGTWVLLHFFYKIDEETHRKMIEEIDAKKAAKAAESAPAEEPKPVEEKAEEAPAEEAAE